MALNGRSVGVLSVRPSSIIMEVIKVIIIISINYKNDLLRDRNVKALVELETADLRSF